MEAGSSPARITSSRTGTPRSLSPATSEATSERTSAATVLPSSIFATRLLEDREQQWGHLLLAAHHAGQVYYAVLGLGVEGLVHGGAVPDTQELGATLYDVRDHERREHVAVLPFQVLQGVQQLVLALEEAGTDDLHLRDAHLVSRARPVLLGVAADDLLGGERRDIRGGLEHLRPELVRVEVEYLLQVSSDLAVAVRGCRGVQDHRIREEGCKQHLCGGLLGFQAASFEALHDQGGRRADGVEGGWDGGGRLDISDVVVVQDLDDVGLLDACYALPDLGVVDEEHAPRSGVEEVGPRDHTDGHPLLVHGDRRPVVDLHHLLGDLRYEVVGPDGQGVLAHDLPAGNGELYQAARHVRVERREQYGRPPLPGHLQDLILRPYPVGDDEYAGAELQGPPQAPRTVPDHHDVARFHRLAHGVHAHRDDPQLARGFTVFLSNQKLALEHLGHRPDRDRTLGEGGGPARLPYVHAGQVTLRDDPRERAVVFHYGELAYVPPGHGESHVAQRGVLVGDGHVPGHDVLYTQHDVLQKAWFFGPALLQSPPCLGVYLAEPRRHIVVLRIDEVLVLGVSDSRGDSIRIGVLMTRYIDVRQGILHSLCLSPLRAEYSPPYAYPTAT